MAENTPFRFKGTAPTTGYEHTANS